MSRLRRPIPSGRKIRGRQTYHDGLGFRSPSCKTQITRHGYRPIRPAETPSEADRNRRKEAGTASRSGSEQGKHPDPNTRPGQKLRPRTERNEVSDSKVFRIRTDNLASAGSGNTTTDFDRTVHSATCGHLSIVYYDTRPRRDRHPVSALGPENERNTLRGSGKRKSPEKPTAAGHRPGPPLRRPERVRYRLQLRSSGPRTPAMPLQAPGLTCPNRHRKKHPSTHRPARHGTESVPPATPLREASVRTSPRSCRSGDPRRLRP